MAIDFSTQVYEPTYSVFARSVTFAPIASQPNQPPYTGRGIYSTQALEVLTENQSILSDQVTILDILEREFTIMPQQGDRIIIPSDGSLPELGEFEIIDSNTNGGGETTLTIRKVVTANP